MAVAIVVVVGASLLWPDADVGEPAASDGDRPGGAPNGELSPSFVLDGRGDDIDSLAFHEADSVGDVLLLVTSKATSEVEVWRHPFVDSEQPSLRHETFGDSEVNGILVDQDTDLLYITTSAPASTLSVFQLPGLTYVDELVGGRFGLAEEPNLDLFTGADGRLTMYLTTDDAIHSLDLSSGERTNTFDIGADVETVLVDDFWERVYVPDEKENRGIFVFDLAGDPLESFSGGLIGTSVYDDDAEGILLYRNAPHGEPDDGTGFIVASDQRKDVTDFEVFDRVTGRHLATFRLAGVSNTDGIASTEMALPGYPRGLFVAVDDDRAVVGIGWDVVFEALGL